VVLFFVITTLCDSKGHIDICRALLAAGADKNVANINGQVYRCDCCPRMCVDVVEDVVVVVVVLACD
jgi:hypothetical protein